MRDAVLELETDGLVRAQAKSGTYVQPLDAELIREHHELHGILQGHALRLIVGGNYRPALDRLRDRHGTRTSGDFREELMTAAIEYMRVLDQAGPYRRLRALLRSMTRFLPPSVLRRCCRWGRRIDAECRFTVLQVAFAGGPYASERAGDGVTAMWRQCGELLIAHLDANGVLAHPASDDPSSMSTSMLHFWGVES